MIAVATPARAAEPLSFTVPAGWTADAAEAKARQVELYAADTRTDPPAEMVGTRFAKPAPMDEPFVRGFVKGLMGSTPGLAEVKHEFIDINGVRSLRLIADVPVDGEKYRQAYYVMPAGGETAFLTFTVKQAAFAARLPAFDAIARATRGVASGKHADRDEALGERIGFVVGLVAVALPAAYLARRLLRSPRRAA